MNNEILFWLLLNFGGLLFFFLMNKIIILRDTSKLNQARSTTKRRALEEKAEGTRCKVSGGASQK